MFLRVLNVNLDHYDFLSDFRYNCLSSNDCVSLPAIIDSAMSEDKLTPLQCKKFSCQSLTRVVASLEVHTTASTTASVVVAWTSCW